MPDRVVRYILAGESKGAVRAMHETEVAGKRTGAQLERTGTESEASFLGIEKGAHRARGAIAGLAGLAGLGGLAFGLKDAVEAGSKLQDQQAQLRNALKNTGQLSAATMKQIGEATDRSATHGGFADADELGGITQLVRLTGSSSKAMKLNTEAVELARGAHLGYAQAVKTVEQIQTGSTGKLQKLIGVIQPVTYYVDALTAAQKKQNPELLKHAQLLDKQATAQEANTALIKKFGGATTAYGKTSAGAINNARNAIDLLAEKVGVVLLPYVAKAAIYLAHVADVVQQDWPQISAEINKIIDAIKGAVAWSKKHLDIIIAVGAGLLVMVTAIKAVTLALKAWEVVQAILDAELNANAIGLTVLAIAALTAGVVYCYLHFKTFRNIVNGMFGVMKGLASFIEQHWQTIRKVITLPFEPLVLILEHIKSLIHDVVGAADAVAKVYKGVTGAPKKSARIAAYAVPGLGPVAAVAHVLGKHFAVGGIVPGLGNSDNVPIDATPGEGMLTRRAVAAIGGSRGVDALNRGASPAWPDVLHLTLPVKLVTTDGGRALAETVVHYQLKRSAR